MATQTGISRRIQQALQHVVHAEWESALVNLFPAIDATGKRRRPKDGVGQRVRAFLDDEHGLISVIATGNYIGRIEANGVSVPDALYKLGRTSLMHEGELDPRLKFTDSGTLAAGNSNWELPLGYISGMLIAVVVAPENANESITGDFQVNVLGNDLVVNDLWGQRDRVRQAIASKFKDPALFTKYPHPGRL